MRNNKETWDGILIAMLDAGATRYTPVEGTPQLRKAAAAWLARAHGFAVSPGESS